MTRILGWLAVLLILMLLTPNPANAARLEIGSSLQQFQTVPDDIWFTKYGDYPFHNEMKVRGYSIGLSGRFPEWRFLGGHVGWRVSAQDLGSPSNSAVWAHDEPKYLRGDYSDKADIQGSGSGSVYALTAGPTLNFDLAWNLEASIETGAALYRANWIEYVRHIRGGNWWKHHETGARTDVTWYVGGSLRWKWVFVSLRGYQNVHAYNSVFDHHVKQVTVGISIPLNVGIE